MRERGVFKAERPVHRIGDAPCRLMGLVHCHHCLRV